MNRTYSIVFGLVLVLMIGAFVYFQKQEDTEEQAALQAAQEAETEASNTGSETTNTKSITSTEVAQHKNATSCWSSINGNVYDLTSWIPKHPGGEQAILSICGIDGSAKFNGQHGGAALQAGILAGFKIGSLTK